MWALGLGDSALGLKSWIAAARLCDRRPSLISALALQSPDLITQILESQNGIKRQRNGGQSVENRQKKGARMKKVDSSMDRHAVQAPLAMTENEQGSRVRERSENEKTL